MYPLAVGFAWLSDAMLWGSRKIGTEEQIRSLVRLGRVEEGARVLDEVGQLPAADDDLSGLRDKANVALGYAWLQAERPDRAQPSLQRVRLQGPFSNKALLGVGWSDAERGDYRAALSPWLELRQRNILDPAVQESLLAVPYAFGQLGANPELKAHRAARMAKTIVRKLLEPEA